MLREWRSQLNVIFHSRGPLLLLAVCLALAWFFANDGGLDAYRDRRALEEKIEKWEERGVDGLEQIQTYNGLEGIDDPEEILAILRRRQIIMPPALATNGMIFLLFLLPGITLTPGLAKSRGILRELQFRGRPAALLSRMLLSLIFSCLLSTALYLLAIRIWSDPGAAVPGQLLRNWAVVELYVLALLCYSYFMTVLLRHTAIAAAVMLMAEMWLHEIVPGLRLFYPIDMVPYYNGAAYLNTESLTAAGCSPGAFLGYCAVCLAYAVVCTLLALLLFRRRELQ